MNGKSSNFLPNLTTNPFRDLRREIDRALEYFCISEPASRPALVMEQGRGVALNQSNTIDGAKRWGLPPSSLHTLRAMSR